MPIVQRPQLWFGCLLCWVLLMYGDHRVLIRNIPAAAEDVQAIAVTPDVVRLSTIGAQQSLTVTGRLWDDTPVDLTPASSGTTYMSSHAAVVQVSPDGLLTAVATGTATITVNHASVRATVQVTVDTKRPPLPNIVFILTDDQRWDTLWAMPIVQEKLVARGVTFTNAFVTTPVCCPVRASLLSGGFYAHNTGVLSNNFPNGGARKFLDTETLATLLQHQGYHTALVGKYLNNYETLSPAIPPGWTQFAMTMPRGKWLQPHILQGSSSQERTQGAVLGPIPQYLTDLEATQALDFLAHHTDQPFFLFFATHAPHPPAIAAPGDEQLFTEFLYRDRAYGEEDVRDKPVWLQKQAAGNRDLIGTVAGDEIARRQLRALQAVDRAVGAIVEKITMQGKLAQTIFIFTSDNGYLWGEHGLFHKGKPYEEAIRVPLVLVVPGVAPRTEDRLVAMNLDLPATVFELAGIPRDGDGHSLLPLLSNAPTPWRTEVFLEYYGSSTHNFRYVWTGLRTKTDADEWKYVEYVNGAQELYDLVQDPYEEDSKHHDPAYHDVKNTLAQRLASFKGLAITTVDLPAGMVGRSYTAALTAWGGQAPYTWEVVNQLPEGLSLDPESGIISGVPARAGDNKADVRVRDLSTARHTRARQSVVRGYRLVVQSFGGSVTGMRPSVVECSNFTTNQSVSVPLAGPTTWDCQAAGLTMRSGEAVGWTMPYGGVVLTSETLSATVTGIRPEEAECTNHRTGQSVQLTLAGKASWGCPAAGVFATPGDLVQIRVTGTVD